MRYKEMSIVLFLWLFPAILAGATGPQMALDKSEHDFGDVQVGDVVETQVRVFNKGDATLVINEVQTSCGCAKAVSRDKEVPPGQETEITVSYDSAGRARKKDSICAHTHQRWEES